jgi:DNA polymerase-3 subunit alpha
VLESFIKGGAFDYAGAPRADLMAQLDDTIKWAQRLHDSGNSNQIGLFGGMAEEQRPQIPNYKPLPEWPVNIKLAHEKEALGFYLTGHPLERFKTELERLGCRTIDKLKEMSDGAQAQSAGVVTVLKLKNTKKGDRYATFVLEDMLDTIEVIVWPDTYAKVQQSLGGDDPVMVSGRLDVSDERVTFVANSIESAIAMRDRTAKEAIVKIKADRASPERLGELKKLLSGHRGECPVKVILQLPELTETVISLPPDMRIEPSERLCNQVEALFGEPVMVFK